MQPEDGQAMIDDSAVERRDPQESDLPRGLPSDLPKEMGNPARRALMQAGYRRLAQCAGLSEGELKHLHGVGPKAIDQLRRALNATGLSFAVETSSHRAGDQQGICQAG
jgi:hypothetical protein